MKVLSVFGTRPEAIKMAPVIRQLELHGGSVESIVCVTAQHRQMLDQVLNLFEIKPQFDLDLMRENQTLAETTARILTALDQVISEVSPDWVLTQGDTTTAMVGTLAAFYRGVKAGHVEAGLRTWDKRHPFPEEINRKIADSVCDLHFAPTDTARQNLLKEGIADSSIKVTGNTVIDALLDVASRPFEWSDGPLAEIPRERRIILVTAHRRESFGPPFLRICEALRLISKRGDVELVYPVHLNPNVKDVVHELLRDCPHIRLIEPLDYLPLVHLLRASYLVLTDSGGLQEEAPGLAKPVLVMRETTERPEGVSAGTVRLVGTSTEKIVTEVSRLLDEEGAYDRMARAINPYGDGRAGARIVSHLLAT